MKKGRTDLALEMAEGLDREEIAGISQSEELLSGYPLTTVTVSTPEGANALGKPQGQYLTLDLSRYRAQGMDAFPRAVEAVKACLLRLLPKAPKSALVAGLGNRAVTPDAVGPRCADRILVTRHLASQAPELFQGFIPVAALAAGVLGTTGIESARLIRALTGEIRPGVILAVDALAARSVKRLCTTIQISDTGITPGAGVGNARSALNEQTLGVPVIALGVPTVVDGATLAEAFEGNGTAALGETLVALKDVDTLVGELSKIMAYGINAALQHRQHLSVEELDFYLS